MVLHTVAMHDLLALNWYGSIDVLHRVGRKRRLAVWALPPEIFTLATQSTSSRQCGNGSQRHGVLSPIAGVLVTSANVKVILVGVHI